MSNVSHQWNGSVLTIISDSGASSADLLGPKGDTGPRGPQGPGGVIYNEEGEVVVDLSEYYTKTEVDDKVANVEVDLSGYATKSEVTEAITNEITMSENIASKNYVTTEIAKAQLAEVAGDVDLSGFATKDDIANIKVNIDGVSIIEKDGVIQTARGGGLSGGLQSHAYNGKTLNEVDSGRLFTFPSGTIQANTNYCIKITFADGVTDSVVFYFLGSEPGSNRMWSSQVVSRDATYITTTSPFVLKNYSSVDVIDVYEGDGFEDLMVTAIAIEEGDVCNGGLQPIDVNYIPVDGVTIIIKDGKLTAVGGGSGVSYPSAEEVDY